MATAFSLTLWVFKLCYVSTLCFAIISPFRGIAPSDLDYYSRPIIPCKDGSRSIPVAKLNDNFCDCADGTDEPGTSACPSSHFYCPNKGHVPLVVFSSRVNDGICDCCDGTDEYTGIVKCKNRCVEEGAASRQKLENDIKKFQEGAKIRQALAGETSKKKHEWKEEIEGLKAEKADLEIKEAELLEKKTAFEKAEEEEREKVEKERKEREEAERALRGEDRTDPETPPESDPQTPTEEALPVHEEHREEGSDSGDVPAEAEEFNPDDFPKYVPEDNEPTETAAEQSSPNDPLPEAGFSAEKESLSAVEQDEFEGLSQAEIGQIIASRWTGGGQAPASDGSSAEHGSSGSVDAAEHEEGEEVPESEFEDDERVSAASAGHDIEEEEEEDEDAEHEQHPEDLEEPKTDALPPPAAESAGSWISVKLAQLSRALASLFTAKPPRPAHTPAPVAAPSESDRVKRDHSKVFQDLQKVSSRVSELEKKLELDYGPDGEFSSFEDQCFKVAVHQYEYEVCPYHKAVQHEGHMETTLGRWKGFDEKYATMFFVEGDTCWNGPQRSLTVSLQCGLENQLSSVHEPSRCEYTAVLVTPAVCSAAVAEALQKELEGKLKELEEVHDEL